MMTTPLPLRLFRAVAALGLVLLLAACDDDNPLIGKWKFDQKTGDANPALRGAVSGLGRELHFTDNAVISTGGMTAGAMPASYKKAADRWMVILAEGRSLSIRTGNDRLLIEMPLVGEVPYCRVYDDPKQDKDRPGESEIKQALDKKRRDNIEKMAATAKQSGGDDSEVDAIRAALKRESAVEIRSVAKDCDIYAVTFDSKATAPDGTSRAFSGMEVALKKTATGWEVAEVRKKGEPVRP